MDTVNIIKNSTRKFTDEELTQMAIDELNREMVKAKARVEVGKNAYIPPCPLKKTNKRFLNTTIKNAITFNRRQGQSQRIKSMKKLYQVDHNHSSSSSRGSGSSRDRERTSKRSHSSSPPQSRTRDVSPEVIELD